MQSVREPEILRYIGTGQLEICRTPGSFLSRKIEDEATDKTLIPAAVSDAASTQFWRFTKFRRRFQLAGGRLGSTGESPPGSTPRLVVAPSDVAFRRRVVSPSEPWRTSQPTSQDSYVACCLRLHQAYCHAAVFPQISGPL